MWRPLAALAARGATGATGATGASAPGTSGAGTSAGAAPPRRALLLLALLARHCSSVTARRARRAWQRGRTGTGGAAGSGSGTGSAAGAAGGSWWWWWRWGGPRGRPALLGPGRLMAALASGVFVWDGRRIDEEELRRSAQELQQLEQAALPEWEQRWELLMDRERFRLWRRPIPGSHLFQYRVFGSYTDVTPRQFFNVQLDTEYRKQWDSLVIKLDVIERDPATGSEVIHWVTQFPYPMYSRDYVYVRRYSVDRERNLMVLVSRAVDHPGIPEDPAHVRVRSYESRMVIRPHSTFDENGFDYLLTYSDNPQTVFPRYCLSWMVSSGMPEFLDKLHAAALKARKMELEVRDYLGSSSSPSSSSSSSSSSPAKGPEPRGAARLEYA